MLDGQALTKVSVAVKDGSSMFEFDLGGSQKTWPYGDDLTHEQWLLYEPSGYVLTVRADGQFCYEPGNTNRMTQFGSLAP